MTTCCEKRPEIRCLHKKKTDVACFLVVWASVSLSRNETATCFFEKVLVFEAAKNFNLQKITNPATKMSFVTTGFVGAFFGGSSFLSLIFTLEFGVFKFFFE